MEQSKEYLFKTIWETKDRQIILRGRIIGLLNINDWSYSVLFDDNIAESKFSYLTNVNAIIKYTYFNRLICKQNYTIIIQSHFGDDDDYISKDENNIFIFDYNPENDKMIKIYVNKNLKPKNIYINEEDEFIVLNDLFINIYKLE